MMVNLVQQLLPGDPDLHMESVTVGAALKYFLYCLWMKASVRRHPELPFERFQYWYANGIRPLLRNNMQGCRGLDIRSAMIWMGRACQQQTCKAIGWSGKFCGQCGYGTRVMGLPNPTLEQCWLYLAQHQDLAY